MKKILYIVSTLKRGGPVNQLYNIIKYLDRKEFEPYLITLSPEPQDSRWTDYEVLGVHLYSLKLSRFKGFINAVKQVQILLAEIKPDVIHTQGIRADMLNVKLMKSYLSVCTARNYPYYDYPAKFGKIRGFIMAYRHIQVFKKTNVIACSKTIQTLLNRHGINSSAVQNGINFDDYCPVDHHKKDNLRKKLGINDNEFVFISVGSLIPRKDMQTIIEAFNNTRHIKKVKLIILGNGYLSSYLQSGVKNDLVLFPGNVSNVVEYLQAADVFVSSSLSEGLPNTVLEAMACGLPCLLSDIPSHKEIIGEMEWLFSCKDHIKLASLMETIEGMDNCHLGSQSRQKAEKNFNAQKMSELYQDFYRNIQKMPGK